MSKGPYKDKIWIVEYKHNGGWGKFVSRSVKAATHHQAWLHPTIPWGVQMITCRIKNEIRWYFDFDGLDFKNIFTKKTDDGYEATGGPFLNFMKAKRYARHYALQIKDQNKQIYKDNIGKINAVRKPNCTFKKKEKKL